MKTSRSLTTWSGRCREVENRSDVDLVASQPPIGSDYQGEVVKIADGDTPTILVDNQQLKIRLSDIDTPERKQPFGTKVKQALSDLAFGKQARVVKITKDRYGRIVGGSMWMAWT